MHIVNFILSMLNQRITISLKKHFDCNYSLGWDVTTFLRQNECILYIHNDIFQMIDLNYDLDYKKSDSSIAKWPHTVYFFLWILNKGVQPISTLEKKTLDFE